MIKRLHKIGIKCALMKIKHVFFLDADSKMIIARHGAYDYLKKYANVVYDNQIKEWIPQPARKVIWTCWLQGVDEAPLIVRKCISSMQQYANGYDVIIIDANNVTQYIELPEYIHEKFRRGIIPPAHYSDVIRLALLNRYGGIWIDSTILLTDKLPDYIVNADLFVFRNPQVEGHGQISNPFFAAKPSHPIIESVYRLLLAYWENENKLVSYEIMHLFFSIAVENSKTNEHMWKKVPLVYGSHMYYLLRMLGLILMSKHIN